MKTDLITYNLTDRGRKHRGQDRNYSKPENLKALVDAINSGSTQERVNNRDMHGYYGHGVREAFGLVPPETVIRGGKRICLEPDFATTKLKAYKDGTVEHQAEFLPSDGGEKAWKLYQNKIGGFSSAINESKPEFSGFDYVLEPNFAKNRGHTTFDSITDPELMTIINTYDSLHSDAFDRVKRYLIEYHNASEKELDTLGQEMSLTLDHVVDLEFQLSTARDKLSDFTTTSLVKGDDDASAPYDNAESFLGSTKPKTLDSAKGAGATEEKKVILPFENADPLRNKILSFLNR